ncbi:hypothetical protein B1R27_27665, partial [Streptomyces sp. GKU 895]
TGRGSRSTAPPEVIDRHHPARRSPPRRRAEPRRPAPPRPLWRRVAGRVKRALTNRPKKS